MSRFHPTNHDEPKVPIRLSCAERLRDLVDGAIGYCNDINMSQDQYDEFVDLYRELDRGIDRQIAPRPRQPGR